MYKYISVTVRNQQFSETFLYRITAFYALEAGLSVGKDSIAFEKSDSEAAKTYVNIIAVKEGNENYEAIQPLLLILGQLLNKTVEI